MKIEAWGRLNNQKPSVTPTNTTTKMSREYWPCHKQSIPKHDNAIITKALAKPSKPSIKLIAFRMFWNTLFVARPIFSAHFDLCISWSNTWFLVI
jgi:hypothetical protein